VHFVHHLRTLDLKKLPSVSEKLLPVPLLQLVPPLLLNCQLAPDSIPKGVMVVMLVMPSLLLTPVSV
jgi:hypothetical protein